MPGRASRSSPAAPSPSRHSPPTWAPTPCPADLTDRDTLRSLIRDVEQAHGPVDVLVNNAGTETAGHLTDLTADDLENLVALNLLAPVELCRQVLPGMTASRPRPPRQHLVAGGGRHLPRAWPPTAPPRPG
jgi:NAD(P)-dependent dehydrogenase (short-subunit alcohol dehydrogenase family)